MFPVHVDDRAQQLQVDCREWREGLDDPVDVRLVRVEELGMSRTLLNLS